MLRIALRQFTEGDNNIIQNSNAKSFIHNAATIAGATNLKSCHEIGKV